MANMSNEKESTPVDFVQVEWNEQLEEDCRQIIRLAIREDLDRYLDWSTVSLVPAEARGEAHLVVREPGVVSGLRVAHLVIEEMQADLGLSCQHHDGDRVPAQTRVASITGAARDLLTAERILLNFIGRLSGVATLTRKFVEAVQDSSARIYDTRKTTPGWRRLEKYAVRNGGGCNHRVGLFAAIMVKDNHLALSGELGLSASQAVDRVRDFVNRTIPAEKRMLIEIEVDTYEQFTEVLGKRPDLILLDNMSDDTLRRCVAFRDAHATGVVLEASGGVSLDTVSAIAKTGVDRISVGALTHSAVSLDVGLDWE